MATRHGNILNFVEKKFLELLIQIELSCAVKKSSIELAGEGTEVGLDDILNWNIGILK